MGRLWEPEMELEWSTPELEPQLAQGEWWWREIVVGRELSRRRAEKSRGSTIEES